MMYKVQVLPVVEQLAFRSSYSTTSPIKGYYKKGEVFVVDEQEVDQDDNIWLRNVDNHTWCIFKNRTSTNLKIVSKIDNKPVAFAADDATADTSTTVSYGGYSSPNAASYNLLETTFAGLSDTRQTVTSSSRLNWNNAVVEQNSNAYPTVKATKANGSYAYDYTMSMTDIDIQMDVIRKNLNIPSLYTPIQLNRLMHTQFNRYKIAYPDYERGPLLPYVFFTRPDLNIYGTGGGILKQYKANPQLLYLIQTNPQTAKSLTLAYTSEHQFNPLLSNRVGSLDVQDEVLDTVETGETFTGYKSQYSKHGIRSLTAGQLSIKFPESYNMALTVLHQIWCGYQAAVYRGQLDPLEEYMGNRILDYACDIYYFLTDRDGVIRFWTKYYGCFPTNVNKSIFSYDAGALVQFPEMNITYNYIHKEDLSPDTIKEFNENANVTSGSKTLYAKDHDDNLGHYGPTWMGPPFIQEVYMDEGESTKIRRFVLRFRKSTADILVDSAVRTMDTTGYATTSTRQST